ncbi:MAG: hypothetical protein WAZ99_01815 [Rectinemataceae bacterium]
MYEYLDNTKKHFLKMQKQMSRVLGKERTETLLFDLSYVDGSETPAEAAAWATKLIRRLEENVEKETIIRIREECACVYTNKYSAYNKKYFKDIRDRSADENSYLENIALFLGGRPRIGRKVEFIHGELFTYLGEGRKCGCFVVKKGWEKPPSATWCRCCQGSLLSVYRFILPEKKCRMDIVETLATGANDCVFRARFC